MKDRVVLITGGAGNLGRAVTRAFLRAGTRVAVPLYHTDKPELLDGAKAEFGDRIHSFALDLTTERGARFAVEQSVEWGGHLDAVLHLMGGFQGGTRVADTPLEVWDRMVELNLRSAWLISSAAIPAMLRGGGGSLLYVSARRALEGRARFAAYAVAKAGLLTLAEAVAEEYGDEGIRANVVLPDVIDTEDNRRAMPDRDAGNWTPPEQIAEVLAFLASPASGPVNGAAIPVYGRTRAPWSELATGGDE